MIFDKNVYECNLYSITSDIKVNKDLSKRENIRKNFEIKVAEKVMVKPTIRKNIFKEIVTGKLIPAYRISYCSIGNALPDFTYTVPNSPVFIKVHEEYDILSGDYDCDLYNRRVTNNQDIIAYLQNHSKEEWEEKLDSIFQQGEEYYNNAAAQNNYSNKAPVRTLLKAFRK